MMINDPLCFLMLDDPDWQKLNVLPGQMATFKVFGPPGNWLSGCHICLELPVCCPVFPGNTLAIPWQYEAIYRVFCSVQQHGNQIFFLPIGINDF
jgi:hypothetical protein